MPAAKDERAPIAAPRGGVPVRPAETRWTAEQWAAIYRRGEHILVSAAAGAGKTAVLVERVIQRLLDPVRPSDIDRLVVVTFTDAAAAQMRERIGAALQQAAVDEERGEEERAHLRRQLTLLDRAPIQTLHGFCLWLLRRYFYLLDLDPRMRVLEEDEAAMLRFEVLDAVLERGYTADSAERTAFYTLIDAYGGKRGDGRLREAMLRLHAYISSLPDPDEWLAEAVRRYEIPAEAGLNDLVWTGVVLRDVSARFRQAAALWARALRLAEAGGADARALQILAEERRRAAEVADLAAQGDWRRVEAAVAQVERYDRLTMRGVDDIAKGRIQAARDRAKKSVRAVVKSYFALPEARHLELLRETAGSARTLVQWLRRFDEAYQEAKRRRGVVDFNDLERYALRLLQIEPDEAPRLSPGTTPRDELRRYFDEVLVDEYQDINPLQDRILASVARPPDDLVPNLFMVGDVKQSIYQFRMADPSLFLGHLHRFVSLTHVETTVAEKAGLRIDLAKNFRSRRHVVDAVNFLFRQILIPEVGGIAYDRSAELVAGADYPPQEGARVEVHLLERAEDRSPAGHMTEAGAAETEGDPEDEEGDAANDARAHWSALEREAWFTAWRVKEMLEQRVPIYDRDAQALRPVRPRDIVILLRSTKVRANPFVDAFRALDIPVYAESGTGYFWAVEVESVVALLRVIDNPRQDIPLAAVLRMPWIDVSTHDLARIRLENRDGEFYDAVVEAARRLTDELGERLRAFLAQLERWRTLARGSSLGDLVRAVLDETGYLEYVQGLPGGRQRRANLDLLIERARRFDADAQGGLGRFLQLFTLVEEAAWDQGEAPVIGEGEDVVRVMSIHKSKGLQFPVVIVADCGKEFNLSDTRGAILYQRNLGIGLEWVDAARGVRHPTLAQTAVSEARRLDALAEELRILYVALTRAQEHLILIGSVADVSAHAARWSEGADQEGWALPDYIVRQAVTYLDWIVPALMRHADGEPLRSQAAAEAGRPVQVADPSVAGDASRWRVEVHPEPIAPELGSAGGGDAETRAWLQRLGSGRPLGRPLPADLRQELAQRLEWHYPHREATRWPAKVSVSLLARVGIPEDAQRLQLTGLGVDEITAGLPVPSWLTPADDEATSPAARGVATHLLLDRLDLTAPVTELRLRNELDELVSRGLVAPVDAKAVEVGGIQKFFASELGHRLRSAFLQNRLWREWSFTVAVDPANFAAGASVKPVTAGGDPAAEPSPREATLLQGTIDALWQEDDGELVLIDYKTDRVASVSKLVRRYRRQLALYRYAVERILGRRPTVYLVPLGIEGASGPIAIPDRE